MGCAASQSRTWTSYWHHAPNRSHLSAAPLGPGVCMRDLLTTSTCPAGGIHQHPSTGIASSPHASPGRALTPYSHYQLQVLCLPTPLCSPQNWECRDTIWASSLLTGILPGHFSPVLLSLLQSLRVVSHILWRRVWQRTPVFLPGKPHGQRNLVGDSPWGCKELVMTQWLILSHML